MRKHHVIFFLLLFCYPVFGQHDEYKIDIHPREQEIRHDHLHFSGTNPSGTSLDVNNKYFIKNGKPWFPVMGEFHYVRYPQQYWEEQVVKMKSAGLSIVATYIFWNAHEDPKGTWNWEGIRDLRHFVELCQKHDMYVWLRIGPWSHGEQLHGGHPDWISNMKGRRSNNPKYLAEAKKLYTQIGQQVEHLFFKDGGPIIGVQLENEYASGDPDHIGTLKQMALLAGIEPVYFTITSNTVFHDEECEAIPLQGGYPYRGWEKEGGKATKNFLYANDQWIMSDALGKVYYDVNQYPRGLCEQGCGSQMTYRNRFTVEPHVVEAHLQNQIGRGMNLVGYYMFQGGTQLPGLKEPGYPESYDFQAPLSEFGFVRPSYKSLKLLHHFINDFGSELATMVVAEPENPVRDELNKEDLRYVARSDKDAGFLFLNNAQVRIPMPDKRFKVKVNLVDETLVLPRRSLMLKGEKTAILPFNLENHVIKYATAQPMSKIIYENRTYLFFTEVTGMDIEFALNTSLVDRLSAPGWKVEKDKDITYLAPGDRTTINITTTRDREICIVLLNRKEAENSWRVNIQGQESIIITDADVLAWHHKIEFRKLGESHITFEIFPEPKTSIFHKNIELVSNRKDVFSSYKIALKEANINLAIHEKSLLLTEVELPVALPEDISDIVLKIDYWGGAARATMNGKILTDHLFHGLPWKIGLKRFVGEGKSIQFELEEWSDSITGISIELAMAIKKEGAGIKKIEVIPQYSSMVHLN